MNSFETLRAKIDASTAKRASAVGPPKSPSTADGTPLKKNSAKAQEELDEALVSRLEQQLIGRFQAPGGAFDVMVDQRVEGIMQVCDYARVIYADINPYANDALTLGTMFRNGSTTPCISISILL